MALSLKGLEGTVRRGVKRTGGDAGSLIGAGTVGLLPAAFAGGGDALQKLFADPNAGERERVARQQRNRQGRVEDLLGRFREGTGEVGQDLLQRILDPQKAPGVRERLSQLAASTGASRQQAINSLRNRLARTGLQDAPAGAFAEAQVGQRATALQNQQTTGLLQQERQSSLSQLLALLGLDTQQAGVIGGLPGISVQKQTDLDKLLQVGAVGAQFF